MPVGGINSQQPYVGIPPTAGVQAGTVDPAGGALPDGLPRTVALGTAVAANGFGRAADASAAAATAASQQLVDPSLLPQQAAGAVAPAPAAWNEGWVTRFKEAGAPAEMIQQLAFTGAMGAGEAELEQVLAALKANVDTQLAQFAHEHPREYRRLRGNPAVDRALLAQIAQGVNTGEKSKLELEELVNTVGKSGGRAAFDMFVKPMLVWSLIPGWGALRIPLGIANGGRDPLTGERMWGDKMSTSFTVLAGIGGAITLGNHARGALQVAQGHRLASVAGSDAALIAANEGLENLTAAQRLRSFVPGTQSNRVFGSLVLADKEMAQGVKSLTPGSLERELAENAMAKWRSGEISILRDPASKWTKMGFQPNARNMVIGRNKPMFVPTPNGSRPGFTIDGRLGGRTAPAHLAAMGASLADDTVLNHGLKSRMYGPLPHTAASLKVVQERTLGTATTQLFKSGYLSQPTTLDKVLGGLRPGPLQDALWAQKNVLANTIGAKHGTAAVPMMAKVGIGGALAAGGGYFMMRQQQAALAKATAAAPGAGAASPELQAALERFAALPPAQQAQVIQEQQAMLQQAAQQPNLTPQQEQEIQAAAAELQQFIQVAQGAAVAAPAAASPATAHPTGSQPAFTARGLGLEQG